MDGKWCFNSHIEKIISYSLKLLGLIKRNCKDFKNSKSLLSLYYAYIYSKLNFASSIWSPSSITYINRLERVQNKFLRFLSYKFNFPIENHNYIPIITHFKILQIKKDHMRYNCIV